MIVEAGAWGASLALQATLSTKVGATDMVRCEKSETVSHGPLGGWGVSRLAGGLEKRY